MLDSWPSFLGSGWLDADEDFPRGASTETIDDKVEASVILFRGFEGFHKGADASLRSFCVLAMEVVNRLGSALTNKKNANLEIDQLTRIKE